MISIILKNFFFLYIIYSFGLFFLNNIFRFKNNFNFYETSLIGLIFILFVSQFLNYFVPLNDYLLYLSFFISIYFFILNKKSFFKGLHIDYKIFALVLILSIINIYASGFSDDIDHYHYSSITNYDEKNLIWGITHLHPLYGTMSLWLTGHSFFNFDNSRLQDIHILNGLIFLLVLGLYMNEIFHNKSKHDKIKGLLFSILIFILFKYTRLKEFGIDRPAILLFCFLIYYYLKFLKHNSKNFIENFVIISAISFAIISIKITYLPVIILPIILFFLYRDYLLTIEIKYLTIIFVTLIFFSKNILSSGCFIYPISITCLDSINFSDPPKVYEFALSTEIFNKSWSSYEGTLAKDVYIQDFNWINTWFNRGKVEILELLIFTLICSFISLVIFNFNFNNFIQNYKSYKILFIYLILVILFSFFIYIFKNPVIRMNHHVLISLNLIMVCLFIKPTLNKVKRYQLIFFIFIGLMFNFSKNFNRIYQENFVNDPYMKIVPKINKTNKRQLDNFKYSIGWYGSAPIGNQDISLKKYNKFLIFDIISNDKYE